MERFWSKVKKGTKAECWPWTRYKDKDGYGSFWLNETQVRAHRMAYILVNGFVPDGKLVLHKCDNPSCCNPSHLFLGTHLDNMRDKTKKKRHYKGQEHWSNKLTEKDISYIRSSSEAGVVLSEKYGVNKGTISKIRLRKTWKHVE